MDIGLKDRRLLGDLLIAGPDAEYDSHAKQLLAHKIVLAHILVSTVWEFKGLKAEEVVPFIEGEPEVARVPVNPGETNAGRAGGPLITGAGTESKIPNEGTVTFDVRFYVWVPGRKEKVKIIVDIEAQKDKNKGYDFVTRGIFYGARMISAQLDTEFKIPDYNGIRKVYSIWIFMNVPKYAENTAVRYQLSPENIVGDTKRYGRYDLLSVVEVNLSRTLAEEDDELKLHRFLGTIFNAAIRVEKKTEILSKEYGIRMTDEMERRLNLMCNLSEAILEEGMEKGLEKGLEKGMEKGQFQQLYELIQSGDISMERAAKRKRMRVEDLQKIFRELEIAQ